MSKSIETLCVHGDSHRFPDSRESLSMPIYQTAAFGHPDLGHSPDRFYYTRLTNPPGPIWRRPSPVWRAPPTPWP